MLLKIMPNCYVTRFKIMLICQTELKSHSLILLNFLPCLNQNASKSGPSSDTFRMEYLHTAYCILCSKHCKQPILVKDDVKCNISNSDSASHQLRNNIFIFDVK